MQDAHQLHTEIHDLVRGQARCDIRLGMKLHDIKTEGLYKKAVGAGADTWVDYLKQPEIGITPARASKLIRVYEHFCLNLGISLSELETVPFYALDYIASRELVDVDGVQTLLSDARVLTQKDFKERYHDEVVQTERTYVYLVMKKCVETGSMEKVHYITSEEIISKLNICSK